MRFHRNSRTLSGIGVLVLFCITGCTKVDEIDQMLKAYSTAEISKKTIMAEKFGEAQEERSVSLLIQDINHPATPLSIVVIEALEKINDPRAIGPLINKVKSDNHSGRKATIRALGVLKARDAVDTLVEFFTNEDEAIFREAVMAVGKIGDPKGIEPVISVLNREGLLELDSYFRGAFAGFGSTAFDLLTEQLSATNRTVRYRAVEGLGEVRDKRALPQLIELSEDLDKRVRGAAIEALGKVGGVEATQIVQAAAQLEDASLRRKAASGLSYLDSPDARNQLIAMVHDEDTFVRSTSAKALGRLKEVRAIPGLVQLFNEQYMEMTAAEALISIGVQATPEISKALDFPGDEARFHAAYSLDKLADEASHEALIRALKNKNHFAIAGAAKFYMKLGERGSEPTIIEALSITGKANLASQMLNSGNFELSSAAETWYKDNGYEVFTRITSGKAKVWGSR